jgi:hypothetical protein
LSYRDALVIRFAKQMRYEMVANEWKGGWLDTDPGYLSREVLYHAAKLELALLADDKEAIRELAADVANCAMILAERMGVVDRTPTRDTEGYVASPFGSKLLKDWIEERQAEVGRWFPPVRWTSNSQ